MGNRLRIIARSSTIERDEDNNTKHRVDRKYVTKINKVTGEVMSRTVTITKDIMKDFDIDPPDENVDAEEFDE